MANNVGTWNDGDVLKYLRVQITDDSGDSWGEAIGVNFTPYLECRKSGATALTSTITGEWQSGGVEYALFAIGATSALVPTGTTRFITYEALVKLVSTEDATDITYLGMGESGAEPLSFAVQVWP